MSRFSYSAVLASGERVSGVVRSRDAREATRKLLEMGYHPVALDNVDRVNSAGRGVRELFERVRTIHLAVFTRQLASILKAGLSVAQAIHAVQTQSEQPKLRRVLREIEESLTRDGNSLSDAMEEHADVFDPVYRGLVRSGEEGGSLVEVLLDLSQHLTASAKLKGQVLGALIYPVFLVVLGVGAIFAVGRSRSTFDGSIRRRRACPAFEAFTLVELMVATGIVVVALLGVYAILKQSVDVEGRAARIWDDRASARAVVDHLAAVVESAVDYADLPGVRGGPADDGGQELICTSLSGGSQRVRVAWGIGTNGQVFEQVLPYSGSRDLSPGAVAPAAAGGTRVTCPQG